MILPTEKHPEHPDRPRFVINIIPIDRAVHHHEAKARQDIPTRYAALGKSRQTFRGSTDTHDTLSRMIQGLISAFAEARVAFDQMIEN